METSSAPLLISLTPPGRGAVASLRIEGPGGLELMAGLFTARNGLALADIPLRQIVVGQFGGALAFGLLGVFVGPVLLGVGYTLVLEYGDGGVRSE